MSDLLPTNMSQYIRMLRGDKSPLTESNLRESDLNVLRGMVKGNKGELNYGDYREDGKLSNFEAQETTPWSIIKDSVSDPAFRMETTLGSANYHTNPKGETVVTDEYDFNASRKNVDKFIKEIGHMGALAWALRQGPSAVLNYIGNAYGTTEDEQGAPVNINLGKVIEHTPDGN